MLDFLSLLWYVVVLTEKEAQPMKSMIQELWHGNIIPQEDSRNNSKEMKELRGYYIMTIKWDRFESLSPFLFCHIVSCNNSWKEYVIE